MLIIVLVSGLFIGLAIDYKLVSSSKLNNYTDLVFEISFVEVYLNRLKHQENF